MMKRRLCIALACVMTPMAASAQTTTTQGRLDIVADAPSACVVASAASVAGANATFQAASDGAEVRITELIDPQTGQARASSINVLLPITCNTAHRLVLSSDNGGLLRAGGDQQPADGFREFVPYQVSASWSGQSVSASSTQGPVSINVGDGAAGEASVTIDIPAGGDPLVSGAYADAVVIELRVEN